MDKEQAKPLIRNDSGYVYVMVSHNELDSLVAKLMHLAEMDSDVEHRNAVKGELKMAARGWLDNLYADSGYVNHNYDNARVVDVK